MKQTEWGWTGLKNTLLLNRGGRKAFAGDYGGLTVPVASEGKKLT